MISGPPRLTGEGEEGPERPSKTKQVRDLERDGVAAHAAQKLVALAFLEGQLNDVAGAKIIADQEIQPVLALPGLPEVAGIDEQASCQLEVKGAGPAPRSMAEERVSSGGGTCRRSGLGADD